MRSGKGSEGDRPEVRAGETLRGMAAEAIAACDAAAAVARAARPSRGRLRVCGREVPLEGRGRLLVFAFGKAAATMWDGLRRRLEEAGARRRVEGLVVAPPGPAAGDANAPAGRAGRLALRVARLAGDHPLPLRRSFLAARRAMRLAASVRDSDDLIHLVSGGGSAMLASPLAPFLKAGDKTALHRSLLLSGAPIGAINTVRRHLSAIKGGRLALLARRARCQNTLVICDVDPERWDEVASGPTLPDPTTLDDFVMTIDRYALAPGLPPAVLEALRRGRIPETPKPRDAALRRCRGEMILSNRDLCAAAVRASLARGIPAETVPADLSGPVEEAVERVARAIEAAPAGRRLLVLGGEVLVVPAGPGRGGRAQEFALRLAIRMEGLGQRPWAFLAIGSDGVDGSSDAAGAVADRRTLDRARDAGLDPRRLLAASDSDRFFRTLGDQIVTGPTGTNVRDLYLLLTGAPEGRANAPAPGRPDRGSLPPGSGSRSSRSPRKKRG